MCVYFLSKFSIYSFLCKKEGNKQLVLLGIILKSLILSLWNFSCIAYFYELYWFLTDKSNDLHYFMMSEGTLNCKIPAFPEFIYIIGQLIGSYTLRPCVLQLKGTGWQWELLLSAVSPHSRVIIVCQEHTKGQRSKAVIHSGFLHNSTLCWQVTYKRKISLSLFYWHSCPLQDVHAFSYPSPPSPLSAKVICTYSGKAVIYKPASSTFKSLTAI